MARVTLRTKKTKPSKNSRVRRRQFLNNQKLSDRKDYVAKEKESNEMIDSLRRELEEAQKALQEEKKAREEDRIYYRQKRKELAKKRDEEWKGCWERREAMIRDACREEKEREKQSILEDRAQLLAERNQLQVEVDELKRRFLGYR